MRKHLCVALERLRTLVRLLGASPKWMFLTFRLMMFAILLLPAWMYLLVWHFVTADVKRGVRYGRHLRNDMDVYFPDNDVTLFGLPATFFSTDAPAAEAANSKPGTWLAALRRGAPWCIPWLAALFPCARVWQQGCLCANASAPSSSSSSVHADVPGASNACACGSRHKVPVVVLVPGGAWTIGYKLWTLPTARALTRRGFIVVSLDYRNFPQTSAHGMLDDLTAAVRCIQTHPLLLEHGADPSHIYVVGQSAGAHLSVCAYVHSVARVLWRSHCEAAQKQHPEFEHSRLAEAVEWEFAAQVKRVIAVSGPYDITPMVQQFMERGGVGVQFLAAVFENQFDLFSPTRLLSRLATVRTLPPAASSPTAPTEPPAAKDAVVGRLSLVHGDADASVPASSSHALAAACTALEIDTEVLLLQGTHTQPILEGPFQGDEHLVEHVVDAVWRDVHGLHTSCTPTQQACPVEVPPEPLLPRAIVALARAANPF